MTGAVPYLHASLSKPAKRGPKPKKRIQRNVRPRARSRKRSRVEAGDRAWSHAVRWLAMGVCEWPGCFRPATDAHHVFGKKAHPSLRYALDNGVALCRTHHVAAHADPARFRAWFSKLFPATWLRLQEAARG